MSSIPLVSIGMPIWNAENYLAEALESILAQTFGDFEVLIADNGSTDRSAEIANEYCQRDRRVRYFRHPQNLGAARNFNFVFENTTGKYFRWAAHDDLIAPEYLATCVEALEADNGTAVLAYTGTLRIDAESRSLGAWDRVTRKGGQTPSARLNELIGPGIQQQSILHMCFPVFGVIRRSAMKRKRPLKNMPRADHVFLVELALLGNFIEIEEPLFLRREHDHGSVISAEKKANGPKELETLLAAWFDPSQGKKYPLTYLKMGWGYLFAAFATRMPLREKGPCVGLALRWGLRHRYLIKRELGFVLRDLLRSS